MLNKHLTETFRYGSPEGKTPNFSMVVQHMGTIASCSEGQEWAPGSPIAPTMSTQWEKVLFLFWRQDPNIRVWESGCFCVAVAAAWGGEKGLWGTPGVSPLLNCWGPWWGLSRHWNTKAATTTGWCKFYWDNVQTGHGNKGFDAGTRNVKWNTKIKRY